ncbi:MAG: single-stranded-DNA-specific exonuclease RecJ [Victivallales bacterium]|nr:single-stranded-DNA-specific exonuclease RecJ [Victivallales bacterium]
MGNKSWVLSNNAPTNVEKDLIEKFGFPRPIAVFMAARGISPDQVELFLNPSLNKLSDPYRFPGIETAAKRLWDAILNKEDILIHGDYDTDGVTATALLAWVLRKNGGHVHSFIPHRFDDGYGFTPESLEKAIADFSKPCRVLVTVDCGITSIDAVDYAAGKGIDVIITDHHEPGEELPRALALVNPKICPELEDLHLLSGAGTAFKLSHAFIKYGRMHNLGGFNTNLQDILDYVALGTIADIVPVLGENRIMVKYGIELLKKQLRPGIRALIETSRIKTLLKPSDITFKLAPRINAAGRLGDANTALKLLEADNIVEAYRFSTMLEDYNSQRQEKEQEIYLEAKEQIEKNIDIDNRFSILVAGHDWHQGVIGIVASRLARDYNRPAIVLTIQGGEAHGSGRSIGTLNLVKVLSEAAPLLTRFGGHPMAVGLGMTEENIKPFYDLLEENVRKELTTEDLKQITRYDGRVEFNELDHRFFEYLEQLHPFGHCNSKPIYLFSGVRVIKSSAIGQKHCRGVLADRFNQTIDFIAFNHEQAEFRNNTMDILASPQLNDYYQDKRPQLQIIDCRLSF